MKVLLKKLNKHIEIVGFRDPRLNFQATDSQMAMLGVLSELYTKVGVTLIDGVDDLEKLVRRRPDLIVSDMKLVLGSSKSEKSKVWLSTYFGEHGINFTGSLMEALALDSNKPEAKQRVLDAGLRSSAYFISRLGSSTQKHNLKFPLFVKPTNLSDSEGVDEKSIVHSEAELVSKIAFIHLNFASDALVEEYLPGREFSVAVMRQPHSDVLVAMPIEVVAPADEKGNSFLKQVIKKANTEKVLGVDDLHLKDALSALAIGAFRALGSRDYGRIDMRLDANGMPNFIEANLLPGLSTHGYLSRCLFINQKIGYDEMITSIVNLAFERAAKLPRAKINRPVTIQPVLAIS